MRASLLVDHREVSGSVVLALGLLLAGCSTSGPSPAPPSPSSALPTQAPATVQGPIDQDEDLSPASPSPTWGEQDRLAALVAARSAVGAYMAKGLDTQAWWAQVQPWLTPTAAAAYAGTDPANVPGRRVTGNPQLVEDSSAYLATVSVPTNAGTWLVLLSRTGAGASWLAERLALPGGQGVPQASPTAP